MTWTRKRLAKSCAERKKTISKKIGINIREVYFLLQLIYKEMDTTIILQKNRICFGGLILILIYKKAA